MTAETLKKLSDDELRQVATFAQAELQERADKRTQDAIEEIRRIAGAAQLRVNIGRKPARNGKAPLKLGDRYINPANPLQSYTVDQGRPQKWFVQLRTQRKLPTPVSAYGDV